jgi:glycosyltransferase involved in cell wall biosynthesis
LPRSPLLTELPSPPPGKTGWPWTEASSPLPETLPDGSPWPRLSVVTPSYNQAQFLEETIRSVLVQGYPNLEYMVFDGGSTDGSVDIIRKYADGLAYWVSEPDGGQADAINKGFRRATGDILAWLNSDDTYLPGALRQAVESLSLHPEHDLVYANCDYVDASGQRLQTVAVWDFVPRRILTGIPLVLQPASFFRRRAVDRVGLLEESLRYLMDHDFYVRMVLASLTFYRVDQVWAHFRWHPASKSTTQAIGFSLEMQQIVERTFGQRSFAIPLEWQPEARANAWQSLGEAYLQSGRRTEARSALLKAVRAYPVRSKSLMALALLVDASLGSRLGPGLRRWRYRLPDAPAGGQPFEGPRV